VQEYWNLYYKSLMHVSLLKNAATDKGIFHVGTYRLPTHVPFVNVFVHMCTQILNDETKWSNGKLRRRLSIKDQNGMTMRIDTASKRDALRSMISWLSDSHRVRKHQKKSPRSLHGRWSPVQTKKRLYFWFEGDAPNLELTEKRAQFFRWKGVFLHREDKSENTV
ncbi:MAG: hypothetical protein CL916_09055, partial [Deltaproteobacteria bacterium]|nr:hypothetical protein [Deltaproteobacteria bacterium]